MKKLPFLIIACGLSLLVNGGLSSAQDQALPLVPVDCTKPANADLCSSEKEPSVENPSPINPSLVKMNVAMDYLYLLESVVPMHEAERRAYLNTPFIEGLEATGNIAAKMIEELTAAEDITKDNLITPYPNHINAKFWRILPLKVSPEGTYTYPGEDTEEEAVITLLPSPDVDSTFIPSLFPLKEEIEAGNYKIPTMTSTFENMLRKRSNYTCADWDGVGYGAECAENPHTGLKADRHLQENTLHPVLAEAIGYGSISPQTLLDKCRTIPWDDGGLYGGDPYHTYYWDLKKNELGNLHCRAALAIAGILTKSSVNTSKKFLTAELIKSDYNPLNGSSFTSTYETNRGDVAKYDSDLSLGDGSAQLKVYNTLKQNPYALFARHTSWGHMPPLAYDAWPIQNSTQLIPSSKYVGNKEYRRTWYWTDTAQYCAQKGGRLPTVDEALYFLQSRQWKLETWEEKIVEPPYDNHRYYYVLTGDLKDTHWDLKTNDNTVPLAVRVRYESGQYNYDVDYRDIYAINSAQDTPWGDDYFMRSVWYCVYD